MIKIIREILVRSFDESSGEWEKLEVVPATANLTTETTKDESGIIKTHHLTATIRRIKPVLYDNIQVLVVYDKGSESFGTEDLPVNFDIQQGNSVVVTIKYSTPLSPL